MKFNQRLLKQLGKASRQWMSRNPLPGTGTLQQNMEKTMREAMQAAQTMAAQHASAPHPGVNPMPGPQPRPAAEPEALGRTVSGRHHGAAGAREYRLFVPAAAQAAAPGLVVMLHGCTQDADDFARGTRMNLLANGENVLVLYPQQGHADNPAKCWNWFRPGDQRRGAGEPALLAGMIERVMAEHGVDPARVYIAGLSAGGAMAAVMAHRHPELFAGCCVHSGLPVDAASDVQSAMALMKAGPGPALARPLPGSSAVPTIVFHGDRDTTVSPRNGAAVLRQALAAAGAGEAPAQSETGASRGGARYTRHAHRGANGELLAEHWVIHGGAHAWAGGSPSGTYTAPGGPDASAEMMRFFRETRKT